MYVWVRETFPFIFFGRNLTFWKDGETRYELIFAGSLTARPWKFHDPKRKVSSLPHQDFRGKLAVKLWGRGKNCSCFVLIFSCKKVSPMWIRLFELQTLPVSGCYPTSSPWSPRNQTKASGCLGCGEPLQRLATYRQPRHAQWGEMDVGGLMGGIQNWNWTNNTRVVFSLKMWWQKNYLIIFCVCCYFKKTKSFIFDNGGQKPMGQHKSGSRSPMETDFPLPPEMEEPSLFVSFFLLQQNGLNNLVFGELRSRLPRHTLTMLPFVVKIVKFTHCEDPY